MRRSEGRNRVMNRTTTTATRLTRRARVGLAVLAVVSSLAGAFTLAPAPRAAAALPADPASASVRPTYLLKASLSYAAGTITAQETITIENITKVSISSVNLSVLPRAFGELTSLSNVRVDGKAVSVA